MYDVLVMGGTWNAGGDLVTEAFARNLDPTRFRYAYVPYPATYGGSGVSYHASVREGCQALLNAIAKSPNRVIVAGYSQGAGIAGDVAADIGAGLYPDLEVSGAALIADPLRPPGWSSVDSSTSGIAGQRPITGMTANWAIAERDPITALPLGSPLRSVADLSAYWTMNSPEGFTRWGQSIVDIAVQQRFQRWWSPLNWIEAATVISQAKAYLTDGRHTDAYIREGHCQRLADWVNDAFGSA
ncbi:PE-PPE domain-containing protein [Nocardia sp. CA-128927]|uniref:PE-PPE domain-containing protein n=1 Tax=Nocardia sp. CA-128927 TaxID=3239975 RepID=UPI003D97A8DF